MKNKETRLTIKVTKELKENLKELAESKGLDMSSYLRMLITEKINEFKKDRKD